ncbi:glycosyltransferase [Patescibacteria group bacterium]|nr:glycosyltransferase [Patescibacteria group bacterium]MBU2035978.1 glycosyltransferase [Patescibacteria group bacterium]
MKVSICITVLNESETVDELMSSLVSQMTKRYEVIIVDSGSNYKTVKIINFFQKENKSLVFLKEKCNRAKGRNLAIDMAKNEIIVMTDAGCIPTKNWLKNITKPFLFSNVDVVAGFYHMIYKNKLQKAESFFLGVLPKNFSNDFLPSTRSIAFKKEIWEKVGGFPEYLDEAAEDTVFNYKLIKNNAKFARVKNAIVEWGMPEFIKDYFKKIFTYAKSDAKTKIWIFPGKGLTSHNIKSFFVILRYLVFWGLLILTITKLLSPFYLYFVLFVYIIYIFRKVYIAFGEFDTALLGIFVQFITDFAVITGFLSGLIG